MAQKIAGYIKLQIPAGKATPAPPVGPALGQHGVNIMQFTKEFNEKTAKDAGLIIPVVITVYADRSFSFITKTPPAARIAEKSMQDPERFRRSEQDQGCDDQQSGSAGNCRAENARSERGKRGSSHEYDCRHGKKHGYRCRRLSLAALNSVGEGSPLIDHIRRK